MAGFHGKSGVVHFGSVTVSNLISNVISWSVDVESDIVDATVMTTSAGPYKTYISGQKDWTATVEAYAASGCLNPDIASDLASTTNFSLDTTTGERYFGGAVCQSIVPGIASDGAGTVTYTFQGSGTGGLTAT